MFLAIAVLGIGLGLTVLAAWRVVVIGSDIKAEYRVPRGVLGGLVSTITLLLLCVAILAVWATVIVTLFFMKTGGASGIPLGLALFGFPLVWAFCESIFAASLRVK